MRRLAFQLPDFTRLAWASSHAEAYWKPKLGAARRLIPKLQLETLLAGQRLCALQPTDESASVNTAADMASRGLAHEVLYRFRGGEAYSSEIVQGTLGRPMAMLVIGQPAAVAAMIIAHSIRDDRAIGHLLGYPPCCLEFFARYWRTDRFIDTTWCMAANSSKGQRSGDYLRLMPPAATNLFLKCIGVRPVFHLPCSFDCPRSLKIATDLHELAGQCGLHDEAEASRELLSLPVRWTSLHGISEIETPVFKISSKTDAVARRLTIEAGDTATPVAHAAPGYSFPHKSPSRRGMPIVAHPASAATPAEQAPARWEFDPNFHNDSGFPTRYLMRRTIAPLLRAIEQDVPKRIFHLGCKNGAILYEYARCRVDAAAFGIDSSAERIARGQLGAASRPNMSLECNQIDDAVSLSRVGEVDIAFVMLGRLLELNLSRRAALVDWLARYTVRTIVYAFPGWLETCGIDRAAPLAGLDLRICQTGPCFVAELQTEKSSTGASPVHGGPA